MVRVGIVDFGRMGRLAFRVASGKAGFDIAHIKEAKGGAIAGVDLLDSSFRKAKSHAIHCVVAGGRMS